MTARSPLDVSVEPPPPPPIFMSAMLWEPRGRPARVRAAADSWVAAAVELSATRERFDGIWAATSQQWTGEAADQYGERQAALSASLGDGAAATLRVAATLQEVAAALEAANVQIAALFAEACAAAPYEPLGEICVFRPATDAAAAVVLGCQADVEAVHRNLDDELAVAAGPLRERTADFDEVTRRWLTDAGRVEPPTFLAAALPMLSAEWDVLSNRRAGTRQEWMDAVYGPQCFAFGDDASYGGGGFLVGPDGRHYPIVIPHLRIDGQTYNADLDASDEDGVMTLGGDDAGWTTIGVRSGVARDRGRPSVGERLMAFAGGTTGISAPGGNPLPRSAYDGLRLDRSGWPTIDVDVDDEPDAPHATLNEGSSSWWLLEGGGDARPIDPRQLDSLNRETRRAAERLGMDQLPPQRMDAVAGAADLAVTAGQGYVAAANLDDRAHVAYQAVFEENEDGRRRVLLRTYSLRDNGGRAQVHPMYSAIDPKGQPYAEAVRFAPSGDGYPDDDLDYDVIQGPDDD